MIDRRDLLLGGAMLSAAAGATALTPHRHVQFLGTRKLDDLIPRQIGKWAYRPSEAFILPRDPDSLSAQLYNDTVARLYVAPDSIPVMIVIAYGNVQNDQLQLHRPEVCYAAVGFQISNSTLADLPLARDVHLPVRELVATSDSRVEPICYWTRIGDAMPTTGAQQRWVKLKQQMRGIIPDGVLVRMSTVGIPSPEVFSELRRFGTALVASIAPADRLVLIGPTLAADMRAAGG